MNTFKKLLAKGEFVITAEVAPPKGSDISEVEREIEIYRQCVTAVNITDNQSSIMRASALSIADVLMENGITPIYQITARDRNRLAIQSDLLGASILGVNNVLCLTGDAIERGDHKEAKAVFDVDSVQLVNIAKGLNEGHDSAGSRLNRPTDFFIGAACFPEASPLELEIIKTRKKVQSGACFLQSQAVYDVDKFKVFMESIKDLNVYVLAGIVVLKSVKMAEYMNKYVSGINISQALIEEMKAAKNQIEKGIEIAARLVVELKKFACGIHIMTLGRAESVPEILKQAGLI